MEGPVADWAMNGTMCTAVIWLFSKFLGRAHLVSG